MKINFSGQVFEKYSNIKFDERPSRGSRIVPCGQTEGQTKKIAVAFLNFAKANNAISILLCLLDISKLVNKKYGWNL
jgi:hypothetical protein